MSGVDMSGWIRCEVCRCWHARGRHVTVHDEVRSADLRGHPINDSATLLPTHAEVRKNIPIARGVLDYFPRAMAAIAEVSRIGNEQHNPGQPMHWAKEKSTDHADCIVRHLIERGTRDSDGGLHSAKVAWRALALLETELTEAEGS